METVTRTDCVYKLISAAGQSLNLFTFYDLVDQRLANLRDEVSRRSKIQCFLSCASRLQDPKDEFIQTHVLELGARIAQDLISGQCVSPIFAYSPFEEATVEAINPNETLPTEAREEIKRAVKKGNKKMSNSGRSSS